jgi:ABC-type uncharacterized transport system permease subunit
MDDTVIFSLSALVALIPGAIASLRREARRDGVFWALLGVALAGAISWAYVQFAGAWRTGLSASLWVTITASLGVFAVLAGATRESWRLSPLLFPYLVLLALLATIWSHQPEHPMVGEAPAAWIVLHIVLAVATYSLLTIAAIAGLAVMLQERALKSKQRTALSARLPSIADAEGLEVGLLVATEVVLGGGIATGMAAQHFTSGDLLAFDHKTLLTIVAFIVIGILLIAHFRVGVRGRQAARYVLAAYLLVTLGYPGVKFVTDVILA